MRDWMIPALLLTILLLFGSRKLPDMARSLGQSLRILKSETKALGDDAGTDPKAASTPATPATADPLAISPPAMPSAPPPAPAAEPADGRPGTTPGRGSG